MDESPKYWFRAKTLGWGWGPPVTWQGWVAVAVFVLLLVADALVFPPNRDPRFVIGVFVACGLLVAVCALKGEPPSWNWGRKKK